MAINPDENASIRDECDLFVRGRMEEVLPKIIKELQEELNLQEVNKIGAI
jgi:electron transfer flavoprotein alpha subunit